MPLQVLDQHYPCKQARYYYVDSWIEKAERLAKSNTKEERLEGLNMLYDLIGDPNLSKRFPFKVDLVLEIFKDLGIQPSSVVNKIQRDR